MSIEVDYESVIRNLSTQVADLSVKLAIAESAVALQSEQIESLKKESETAKLLIDSIAEDSEDKKKENGNGKKESTPAASR